MGSLAGLHDIVTRLTVGNVVAVVYVIIAVNTHGRIGFIDQFRNRV